MNKPIVTLGAFFLFLFLYTKFAPPIPFTMTSTTTQKTDSFSVSGEGKVTLSPDISTVSVGVVANGATVKATQATLNTNINAVSASIKGLGVAAKDIETTNYSIYPTYDYQSGTQRITGYQASTTLTIKVRNIDKTNEVIDAATQNGANQVNGVSFDVDDRKKAEEEARKKAVDDAKQKAEVAARTAGFRLGKIVNYSEDFGGYPPRPYPMMAVAGEAMKTADTQLEPGSSEIRVSVTLSYEIQ